MKEGKDGVVDLSKPKHPDGISNASFDESKGVGTVDIRMTARKVTVETLQDSLKVHGVDTDIWQVDRWSVNDWSVTMGSKKSGTGKAETYMNGQVKVWLKRAEAEPVEHMLKRFIADAKKHAPKYKKIKRVAAKKKSGNILEINMPDIHLGRLSWDDETLRGHYDTKIACQLVRQGTMELCELAEPFKPEKFIFVVGNDFYNVDNFGNATTAGTLQDVDARWHKTFTRGRLLVVNAVDDLRNIAPVEIVVVPGNHDRQSAFTLGEVLSAWYKDAKDIKVNNSPAFRKYVHWGKCLIGYTHGKETKADKMPMLMTQDNKNIWALIQFAEWHVAHIHQMKVQDKGGVRIRHIPSIASVDAWEGQKGYDEVREAQGFVWNNMLGNIARLSWTPGVVR